MHRLYQNKLFHPLQPFLPVVDVPKFLAVLVHTMQQEQEAKEPGEL